MVNAKSATIPVKNANTLEHKKAVFYVPKTKMTEGSFPIINAYVSKVTLMF